MSLARIVDALERALQVQDTPLAGDVVLTAQVADRLSKSDIERFMSMVDRDTDVWIGKQNTDFVPQMQRDYADGVTSLQSLKSQRDSIEFHAVPVSRLTARCRDAKWKGSALDMVLMRRLPVSRSVTSLLASTSASNKKAHTAAVPVVHGDLKRVRAILQRTFRLRDAPLARLHFRVVQSAATVEATSEQPATYEIELEYTIPHPWTLQQQLPLLSALHLLVHLLQGKADVYNPDDMAQYRESLGAMISRRIKDAVQECVSMVQQFRLDPSMELECRVGSISTSTHRFVNGIPFADFQRMHRQLVDSAAWHPGLHWNEAVDVYWGDVRGTCERDQPMRFYKITVMERKTFALAGQSPHALRVQVKYEHLLKDPPEELLARPPDKVRLKHGKSFLHQNTHSYDLRVTAEGVDKFAATQKPVVNELEIEQLRNALFLSGHSNVHIAGSLLLKAVQLLLPEFMTSDWTLKLQNDSYTAPARAVQMKTEGPASSLLSQQTHTNGTHNVAHPRVVESAVKHESANDATTVQKLDANTDLTRALQAAAAAVLARKRTRQGNGGSATVVAPKRKRVAGKRSVP